MLKRIINQAQFDALPEAQKGLYVKDEASGNYNLDIDPADIPDVEGLKRKNQELLDEKKREQRLREEAEADRARKAGDLEALETSWRTRLETETTQLKTELDGTRSQLERLTVGRAAVELAAELAVVTNGVSSAKALLPHIERRLKMEVGADGEVKTRVLDAGGKPSAMTLEQLKDEFRHDPAFAPLIQASKAAGSGANGDKGGGSSTKAFKDMSEAERTELYRRDPAEFRRLKAEFDAASRKTR